MKWWSRRHSQWTKNIRFTLLTFCSKENKKKYQIYYIVLRKQRSPMISRFVMIYLLQLRLIFCCFCLLHCTYSQEREGEMKSKKWDGNYCCLLYQNVWMWFQNVWLLGILGYVESRMCGGKKNQVGNDIVTHDALTFCYLKV